MAFSFTGAALPTPALLSTSLPTFLSALLSASLLSSCASDKPASVDWRHGAKHGDIAGFYDADTPRDSLPACLAQLPAEQLAQQRYVKIHYHHVRRMLVEVALLPDGQQVALGDKVELWPEDCSLGKLSRITQFLSP
ncbi:hypothetical protein [Janthinobacterium agaricidamnosum]|uniref:Uncharacterized protein n=1 Tax=Janthinobacterium agaricidamnosum NBRC 102515 = DSM 9628 TaxID=1349767 RepID=W0V2Z4_9BURK|nr:hypothetical protein [Janthinobacterium agaricidamnosum]CDG83209.1 hypothetical protein GJA_2578 [Janthinobacterium agaricidamnosum NBRC 102515 = DSM 9628]